MDFPAKSSGSQHPERLPVTDTCWAALAFPVQAEDEDDEDGAATPNIYYLCPYHGKIITCLLYTSPSPRD